MRQLLHAPGDTMLSSPAVWQIDSRILTGHSMVANHAEMAQLTGDTGRMPQYDTLCRQ